MEGRLTSESENPFKIGQGELFTVSALISSRLKPSEHFITPALETLHKRYSVRFGSLYGGIERICTGELESKRCPVRQLCSRAPLVEQDPRQTSEHERKLNWILFRSAVFRKRDLAAAGPRTRQTPRACVNVISCVRACLSLRM